MLVRRALADLPNPSPFDADVGIQLDVTLKALNTATQGRLQLRTNGLRHRVQNTRKPIYAFFPDEIRPTDALWTVCQRSDRYVYTLGDP